MSFSRALLLCSLSSKEPTKKLYADEAVGKELAHPTKFLLQIQMQGTRFERVIEELRKQIRSTVCVVAAFFSASALLNDFRYANEECSQYKKGLLENPCLTNVELQQNGICSEDHMVDSYRVVLVMTSEPSVSEQHYVKCLKTDFASSLQPEYIQNHFRFFKKPLSGLISVSSKVRRFYVVCMSTRCTAPYKSSKVKSREAVPDVLLRTDGRKVALTVLRVDMVLTPEKASCVSSAFSLRSIRL